jgi:VWFA-related protein
MPLAERISQLAPRYRQWLQNVSGLITEAELAFFLDLRQDYQRDQFIERFWEPRDPEPLTRRNELRERWQGAIAGGTGLPLADPRFLLYLLNGPPGNYSLPDGRPVARCFSKTRELEIWFYGGSERTGRDFEVIFYRRSNGEPYRVYRPGDAVRPISRSGGLPTTDIQALCGDELLRFAAIRIANNSGYQTLLQEVLTPPQPSPEWLANLALATTRLPAGAATFEPALVIDFPARRQSRTAVRAQLRVPTTEAPGRSFEGDDFHHFELTGEVVRDGQLFESFRYRFEGRTPPEAATIPLGFTRYLRPGPATLRLLLHDVFAERYAQLVREVEVPGPEGLADDPGQSLMALLQGTRGATGGEGPSLRLAAPAGGALAGPVRFTARAEGEIDKVTFLLDNRPVFTLSRPPWSVELNLGPEPAAHRVRVVGYLGGGEVATDQIWVNQGAARLRVRLVEPREGGLYPGSLTARVEVETPGGERPERIELWLDAERIATLTEPPLERILQLRGSRPAVVRAVAYLADGSSAEDAVLVNAAGLTEAVEVRLVEIPVLVVDERGEAIRDLAAGEFRLFEEGEPRPIQRLLGPAELPLGAALLIDRSASMRESLAQVTAAAAGFVAAALGSPDGGETRDRLAILSFADRLNAETGFTDDTAGLERALAGLVARGETTLYDSVAEAAASFGAAPGQRALVLFTDGADEGSALGLEAAIGAAQRYRVGLFVIALAESLADRQARRTVERLAGETGGGSWLLGGLDELPGVYREILDRLRARYLLTFTAPETAGDGYRRVRIEVERGGARVEAQAGYYP